MYWISHIRHDEEPNGVVSQGEFRVHKRCIAFTTREPSPGQWIALATVRESSATTT